MDRLLSLLVPRSIAEFLDPPILQIWRYPQPKGVPALVLLAISYDDGGRILRSRALANEVLRGMGGLR